MSDFAIGILVGIAIVNGLEYLAVHFVRPWVHANFYKRDTLTQVSRATPPTIAEVVDEMNNPENYNMVKVLLSSIPITDTVDTDAIAGSAESVWVYMIRGSEHAGVGFLMNKPVDGYTPDYGQLVLFETLDDKCKPWITDWEGK